MSAGLLAMRARAKHSSTVDYTLVTLHHFDVDPAANAATSYDAQGALWSFTPNSGGYGIVSGGSRFGAKGYKLPSSGGLYYAGTIDPSSTVNPSWNVGSNDFTVEIFVRPDAPVPTGQNCGIVVNDNIGITRGWLMYTDVTNGYVGFAAWVGATAYGVLDTSPLTTSAWTHLAAARDGSVLRLYRDGVQVASTSISGSVGNPGLKLIGNLGIYNNPGSNSWGGALDELRVSIGTCRYPSGTTFTVPSAPFPDP